MASTIEISDRYIQYLLGKIDVHKSGCWTYGNQSTRRSVPIVTLHDGKQYRVCRILYHGFGGKFGDFDFACHKCDEPRCVNPHHIFPGTVKENGADMRDKGRNYNGLMSKHHVSLVKERRMWLRARDLTMRQFSESTGIDYNTVSRWFGYGRTPRSLYSQRVLSKYPNFPM